MGAGTSIAESPPRFGHFSAAVEGHLCVSGGRTKGFTKEKGELVHTFNQLSESWSSKQCQGPSPPGGLYLGASAYAGHHLYLYGGYYGPHNRYRNSLHQLDTRSWTWSHLYSAGPMPKAGCGMVTYDETLLCFGGYGTPSGTTQPGAEFTKESKFSGWTNEFHAYDLNKGEELVRTMLPAYVGWVHVTTRGVVHVRDHCCGRDHIGVVLDDFSNFLKI